MDLTGRAWAILGDATVYRFVPPTAPYSAASPWVTTDGRFDDGVTPTLYLSFSPEGAIAEFYRRHSELLAFQGRLKVQLFRVNLSARSHGLDVSTQELADEVGVPFERLRSSDLKRNPRYHECRQLSKAVHSKGGISVHYPSAAYEATNNVVAFGAPGISWEAYVDDEVPVPVLEPALVRVLPVGADL